MAEDEHPTTGGLRHAEMDRELGCAQRTHPGEAGRKALRDLRLELFQAEQRILDAQLHADYYRARLAFCEEVIKNGIEQVADQRKGQHESSQVSRPGLKLTATQ
ncbi:hypothetical protein [Paraburkholderia madseniana]|uniref:hypothetical protein n=1 Tax=Paraburkholderia madseniana TaxID=2599607 RepID=UPI001F1F0459|nr:hypothetical protein [Paraburkholderia madseniana]